MFLEHAVIHIDHLQDQPGNMWEISAACQMVMATMKWWHKHFSPWKSNLVCSEKMSPWNRNVFDPGDGMQQHFKITNFALVPLLGSKINKEFQDRLEQVGGQMLLYQFVGAKTEVSTIPIYNCTKLCLVLLGHEIMETLISITSVIGETEVDFSMGPRWSQFKLSTHRKLQKRQLEGKLNLQVGIMSYTCLGITLPCGPTYHIYSFCIRLPCGANLWEREELQKG